MGSFALRYACISLLLAPAASDEMAFVDVTATDEMTVRFLDVRVKSKAGIAGLFEADPMISHDWTSTKVVNQTVGAVIRAAANDRSSVGQQVRATEAQLAPLYDSLAKNEHSRLDRGAVRYALHRHFSVQRGWSIKGLEPAGSAWVKSMPVTSDVRQLTKYIVPGYVMESMFALADGQGLDLRLLSIFAVSLDRLIHAEMTEYLHDVFTTLELPVAGQRSQDEVALIVETFAMLYALGSDLETSTKRAMQRLGEFLSQRHGAWAQLRVFAQDLLARPRPLTADFAGLLGFVETLATDYAGWQSRDCKLAQDVLQSTAGFDLGRVPLDAVQPHRAPGHRALFTETSTHMRSLGVLDGEQLVMTNYLLSQDMCLSTSSFYSVCCPDACNARLALLEGKLRAPAAGAAAIADALGASAAQRAALEAAAAGSVVALHGAVLSKWLHEAFPTECPAPSEQFELNPRTADEWMRGPRDDAHETEELMSELSVAVSKFATLGLDVTSWEEAPEDVELPTSLVEAILGGGEEEGVPTASRWQAGASAASRLCLALLLLGSMLGMLRAALSSALGSVQGRGAKGQSAACLV